MTSPDSLHSRLQSQRHDFKASALSETDAPKEPYPLFAQWVQEALDGGFREPYAFTLATNGPAGPQARVVYMRGLTATGFDFFTNYTSQKAQNLEFDNRVCGNFFWPEIERQVRVLGTCTKLSEQESDAYFQSRPRESQLGAWASEQSKQISSRNALEQRLEEFRRRFDGLPIPRPLHWGGYRIYFNAVEFWQGRPSRLHDRLEYRFEQGVWVMNRLNP